MLVCLGDVGAVFACVGSLQAVFGFLSPLYNKLYAAVRQLWCEWGLKSVNYLVTLLPVITNYMSMNFLVRLWTGTLELSTLQIKIFVLRLFCFRLWTPTLEMSAWNLFSICQILFSKNFSSSDFGLEPWSCLPGGLWLLHPHDPHRPLHPHFHQVSISP